MSAAHPLHESARHTYAQISKKFCAHYGVADAERHFTAIVKGIRDGCKPDKFGLIRFASLKDYWEHRQMEQRWSSDPASSKVDREPHTVEIYAVRAVGAGGELGVLTTAHELEDFIIGLASASSKFIHRRQNSADQLERDLLWIFKNSFPLAFKLAGYKADQVVERHVLMCGSNAPSADDIVASA